MFFKGVDEAVDAGLRQALLVDIELDQQPFAVLTDGR